MESKYKHGHAKSVAGPPTRTYQIWVSMKARCFNPKHSHYHRYGGRGITVCERWLTFENFLADLGEIPEGQTIDRIDNDGIYEPSNVRFATRRQQCNNTSYNVVVTHNGESKTLAEWARVTGINKHTLKARHRNGWPVDKMLSPELADLSGANNPSAKLTADTVKEMRRLYEAGKTKRELSAQFVVGYSQVSRIINRESWRKI